MTAHVWYYTRWYIVGEQCLKLANQNGEDDFVGAIVTCSPVSDHRSIDLRYELWWEKWFSLAGGLAWPKRLNFVGLPMPLIYTVLAETVRQAHSPPNSFVEGNSVYGISLCNEICSHHQSPWG